MRIDTISFLPAESMPSLAPATETVSTQRTEGAFANWFEKNMDSLNTQMVDADQAAQQLAAGDASNLHDVMIRLQEAKLSLQLMLQVRNHMLDAYHEISQMQL